MADLVRGLTICFGGVVKYGALTLTLSRYVRLLPVLLAILLFAGTSSAATLCVDGDTLANYIAAQSCFVNAGSGVQLLFSFDPAAFNYSTDSVSDPNGTGLTASNVTVFGVTGPGVQAGLRFVTPTFAVPGDATVADINLTFGVSIFFMPVGSNYRLTSAHLGMSNTLGPDSDAYIGVGETDQLNSAFNLALTAPPDPGDLANQNYSPQLSLSPNIDLFLFRPQSSVANWVESFDLSSSSAPEPGTLALIPGAMILFGLVRNRRYAKSLLPMLALLALFAAKSHASTLCTNLNAINGSPVAPGTTSLTIDKYIAYTTNFGGCSVNDMLFKFTSFTTSGTGSVIPTAASTKLIFSSTYFPATHTKDVQLNYLFNAGTTLASQNLVITFAYSVTAPTSKITKMTGSTTVTGSAPPPTRLTNVIPNTSPAATGSPFSGLNPSITFNNPLTTTFTVTDRFNLVGVNKHISTATDKFTEVVPEPATSLLISSALFGLGLIARRRKA